MSQCQAILEHLKAGYCIDPMTALHKFGTARLAARIGELREAGYRIISKPTTVQTRAGKTRIAVYKLAAE